jgi:hypothetical protein
LGALWIVPHFAIGELEFDFLQALTLFFEVKDTPEAHHRVLVSLSNTLECR